MYSCVLCIAYPKVTHGLSSIYNDLSQGWTWAIHYVCWFIRRLVNGYPMSMLAYLRLDMGYPTCVLVYPYVMHGVYNMNGDLSLSYTLVIHVISPYMLGCNRWFIPGLYIGCT